MEVTPIVEFKSIKWIARKLFYIYKFLGVLTIPLISILFVISTANLLSSGKVTTTSFDVAWAIIYSICFEMNGLRLVIDARIEQLAEHQKAARVDYAIGISLVFLGTATTFIEGLVNAKVMGWDNMKGWIWLVLLLRSLSVIAMIIRECVHYAPLVEEVVGKSVQKANTVTPIAVTPVQNTVNVQLAQAPQPALPSAEVKALPEPEKEDDKIEKSLEALAANPQLTDEELAEILGLRRPASARFWRLKAQQIHNSEEENRKKEAEEMVEQREEEDGQLPNFIGKTNKPDKIIVKTVNADGEAARKIAVILQRYREEGKAVPSQAKLAQEAEVSRMTVIRYMKAQRQQS